MKFSLTGFINRWFPERMFYYRANGSVRFQVVSTAEQIIMALGALAIVFWIVYATFSLIFSNNLEKELRNEYRNILASEAYRQEIRKIELRGEQIDAIQRELQLSLDRWSEGNLLPQTPESNIPYSTYQALATQAETLQDQVRYLRMENDQHLKRLNKIDAWALENTSGAYEFLKHTLNVWEPENTFTPNERLGLFIDIVKAIFFGIAAGMSAVFSIIFSRIIGRFLQPKSTKLTEQ